MYKDRRQRKIIMFSLIFTLICMTVGYASFQSNLNITGSSTVTSNWDIEITNVTSGTASGTAENTVSPTWDKLTASMEANLYGKDDSMEYDVTIENKGTLDAKLEDITTNLENANNDAVVITFSGYTKGEKLLKGESKTIHVKIAYNPSYTGDETSSEVEINFNYVQNNNEKSPSSSTYLLTYDYSTNGGTSTDLDKEYLTTGDSVNLEYKAIKKGYTFVGWNTDKDSEVGLETYQMPSSNTTLYAIYSKTLKVTYTKEDNVTAIGKESDTCTIYNNVESCSIILPSITVDTTSGYSVDGWYLDSTKVGVENDKYTIKKDVTLVSKAIEPEPIMMARDTSKAFWQSTYDSKISTVDILTNKDVPDNAVASWDVSEKQNKSVMAWIVDDSENSGMYKLYIGGNGKVIAPSNSSFLFSGFGSSSTATFYKTTSMNLENLDTSKVTNMSGMFKNCKSLTSLDVSNFDTNKVTNMSYMFSECSSLTKLLLCSFNTNKVTNMDYMFYYTSKITTVYVGSSWTTKNATTTDMFSNSGVSAVVQSDNCGVDVENISISFNTSSTTKSITVVVSASADSGITKYEYSKDGGSTWVIGTSNIYTFTDLTQNTSYMVNARVTSNAGNIATSDNKEVTTSSITIPTFSESGTATKTVEIAYPSGCGSDYTCTYQKDNETEVSVTSTTATVTFTNSGNVVAKVSDGTNSVSSSYTLTITAADILKSKVVTEGDGLYVDDTETGRYVFKGKEPSNFITLGTDTYRIISVESDETIKVIKNESVESMVFDPGYSTSISGVTDANSMEGTRYTSTSTDYCYYTSSTKLYYGCKVWGSKTTMLDSSGNNITTMPKAVGGTEYNLPDTEAYINTYLNSTWLNTLSKDVQNKIVTHLFNVGVVKQTSGQTLATDIEQEQAYKWKGKVGLMNVSDYIKSNSNTSLCGTVYANSSSAGNYSTCKTTSWIFALIGSTNFWTITPNSNAYSNYTFQVTTSGNLGGNSTVNSRGTVPVFFLSSSITLSGDGTSSSPYILSGD